MTGLLDELIPAQQRAIRLSPRDPQIGLFYCRIGSGNLLQSRVEEAIAWYERARNATPGHPQFRTFLAASYALVGDAERAAAELAQARRLVSDDRYASTANVRAITCWGDATISALAEETYFAGLRKAGMPED
jgi:tetratricopeptide (TPR) repeat protein